MKTTVGDFAAVPWNARLLAAGSATTTFVVRMSIEGLPEAMPSWRGLRPKRLSALVMAAACLTPGAGAFAVPGQSPAVRTQVRTAGAASCRYKSATFRSLVVTVEPFSSPAEAKSEYHATITSPMTQDSPAVKLSDIGDSAQRLGATIFMLKGNTIYAFSLVSTDSNGDGALRTIALAKSVVPKL